ncbi:hypothetical protein HPB48_018573 [Haemaphysalis longicornis]|uniref:CCHC-type domain-containing protein n=1 Tax=Haemaphysalis longicornis TaxID=44386 RepID=A0A9J6G5M5_HAELO|nr:hypothetical protein HPB48_018573 [Haemaphysalis longicornis]
MLFAAACSETTSRASGSSENVGRSLTARVIHGIDQGTTQEQLSNTKATTEPRIIDARMLGASTSAVIAFEGPHVPFYIKAYGHFTRCRPYRQTVQCCSRCGELGHRRVVCPNPDTSTCAQCHAKDPAPDHDCTPCGSGPSPSKGIDTPGAISNGLRLGKHHDSALPKPR